MAILITVIACDECHSTVGIKTDDDWKVFDKNWWEGFKLHFCPECAVKPATQARRINDSRDIPVFLKSILEAHLCK